MSTAAGQASTEGCPELGRLRAFIHDAFRPTVTVHAGRVGGAPLAATASKFGGVPFAEEDTSFSKFRFLAQVNFADVSPSPGQPRRGILGIDHSSALRLPEGRSLRLRWHPEAPTSDVSPATAAAAAGTSGPEARMIFRDAWSLPDGPAWEAALQTSDRELAADWDGWELEHRSPDRHRLFGHHPDLEGAHFETPLADGLELVDYGLVIRLASRDTIAGFDFGTRSYQVLAPLEDLARNSLDRAIVAVTNY